jgi:hypothetical protein
VSIGFSKRFLLHEVKTLSERKVCNPIQCYFSYVLYIHNNPYNTEVYGKLTKVRCSVANGSLGNEGQVVVVVVTYSQ